MVRDDTVEIPLFVESQDVAQVRSAELDGMAIYRLEHLVQVETRARDRLEYFAERAEDCLGVVSLVSFLACRLPQP
jgi:hypothetical protein